MGKFLFTVAICFLLGSIFLFLSLREQPFFLLQVPVSPSVTPPSSMPPSSGAPEEKVNPGDFIPPLDRANERVTKKEFGTFITPENSPVQPERFRGYHTGVDFEIFPEELNNHISVQAVCDGKLVMKKYATGYGGVVVESCVLEGKSIMVVYGHLKLSSIERSVGEKIQKGEVLGILGANKSSETDGEREHLHLSFHRGKTVNILGYVQSKSALSDWIDPCLSVCGK